MQIVVWQAALPVAILWAVSEGFLGWRTYSRQSRGADKGSLPLMIGLSSLASALALVFWGAGVGRISWSVPHVPAIGLGLMVLGIAVRWWAILTLRGQFTINVAALQEHRLVTAGPYRVLRHPSYTGTLLVVFGLGLALENSISFACLFVGPLLALLYRIRVEEAMLADLFGDEYTRYQRRTWRLLPLVF